MSKSAWLILRRQAPLRREIFSTRTWTCIAGCEEFKKKEAKTPAFIGNLLIFKCCQPAEIL